MLCKSVRWLEHCKELRHVLEFDELGQTVDIVHLMNNLQIDRYVFFKSIALQIFESNRTNLEQIQFLIISLQPRFGVETN